MDDLQNGRELRVALCGQSFVQAFPSEPRVSRDLRHALYARDITQRSRDERRIAIFENRFELMGDVLVRLQMIDDVPRSCFRLGHCNLL